MLPPLRQRSKSIQDLKIDSVSLTANALDPSHLARGCFSPTTPRLHRVKVALVGRLADSLKEFSPAELTFSPLSPVNIPKEYRIRSQCAVRCPTPEADRGTSNTGD